MAGALTISTLNNDTGSLATQNGMTGICKAWISFNAQANPVTVYASYNIASVTYVNSSTFTLNFTTAMPNTAYTATSMGEWTNGVSNAGLVCMSRSYPPTTNSLTVTVTGSGGATSLYYYINVAVFSS